MLTKLKLYVDLKYVNVNELFLDQDIPGYVSLAAANYDDFVTELKQAESKKECRYGVFDVAFRLPDGSPRNSLVFFLWYVHVLKTALHLSNTWEAVYTALMSLNTNFCYGFKEKNMIVFQEIHKYFWYVNKYSFSGYLLNDARPSL